MIDDIQTTREQNLLTAASQGESQKLRIESAAISNVEAPTTNYNIQQHQTVPSSSLCVPLPMIDGIQRCIHQRTSEC